MDDVFFAERFKTQLGLNQPSYSSNPANASSICEEIIPPFNPTQSVSCQSEAIQLKREDSQFKFQLNGLLN